MTFTIDFLDDGRVLEWEATDDSATMTERDDYTPRFYVTARDPDTDIDLTPLRAQYERHPNVVATEIVSRRRGFRRDGESALVVDVNHVDRVTPLARQARQLSAHPVGDLACFNVDFSRGFRYCLEANCDPTPTAELSTLRLGVPVTETSKDTYGELTVAGETVTGSAGDILTTVQAAIERHDPDILVCSTSEIVPTLYEMATDAGVDDFSLSRWPDVDYQQLASRSTYSSYGRVGHSPARYNVPGRAIIDESNTFFYGETNLDGVLDLVSRSKKPVQELAWASIGNVLTAIQICEAHDRGVLIPWNSWRHELYKPMGTLHNADRGGFIFAPEVGLHENVHELDFSSLYPNIICTRNVSPDVIRCDCHSDRDDVPGLRYSICDDRGYLVDVLQPIIDARDEIKAAIRREKKRDDPDEDRLAELEGRSGALKWILVACFGYQGFSTAKFGRIECHEAINAFAREILLTAKQQLEEGGWCVVHGIVDSIWVTPDPDVDDDDRENLEALGRVFRSTNLELLEAIVAHEPGSIHELARLVDRNPPEVLNNVNELADYGLLEFEENGSAKRSVVWYDEIDADSPPHAAIGTRTQSIEQDSDNSRSAVAGTYLMVAFALHIWTSKSTMSRSQDEIWTVSSMHSAMLASRWSTAAVTRTASRTWQLLGFGTEATSNSFRR